MISTPHVLLRRLQARRRSRAGFTIVELLVAAFITVIISGIMFWVLSETSRLVNRTTGKVEQFRESRNAFETLTTRLSQATLNTYIDYDSPLNPTKYQRRSELRFISGPSNLVLGTPPTGRARPTHATFFQAPFGETAQLAKYASFENLLCTWGYYLEVGTDIKTRPDFITNAISPERYRPRLMEFSQPAEQNVIYLKTSNPNDVNGSRNYRLTDWFAPAANLPTAPVHVIAENIVAFIVTPRLAPADEAEIKGAAAALADPDTSPLAPKYHFDSSPQLSAPDLRYKDGRLNPTHQLPPMLQVTLVAVDEPGAQKLGYSATNLDPLGLTGKFVSSTDYTKDLHSSGGNESLESKLIARRINYRVFSTNVMIRGAKWSREQTN